MPNQSRKQRSNRAGENRSLTGMKLRYVLGEHRDTILGLCWSRSGRQLASASRNCICLWEANSGRLQRKIEPRGSSFHSVAWSPNGKILASGSFDRTVRFWNTETRKRLKSVEGPSQVMAVAWSPDGMLLAASFEYRDIFVWNTSSWKLQSVLKAIMPLGIAWLMDSRTLAAGSREGRIQIWDAYTGARQWRSAEYRGWIQSVACSPKGDILVAGGDKGAIHVRDTETKQQVRILREHESDVETVSFSSDGRVLVSRSYDETLRLWRCDCWQQVAVIPTSCASAFGGPSFHPSNPVLASLNDNDKSIFIWDMDFDVLLRRVEPTRHIATQKPQPKIGSKNFDVFIAYNQRNVEAAKKICQRLKEMGVQPWLAELNVLPGRPFQDQIEKTMGKVNSIAVLLGKSGIGKWQEMEIRVAISKFVERKLPVIPVLLPSVTRAQVPSFLREFRWVRFSKSVDEVDAIEHLVWGIIGKMP